MTFLKALYGAIAYAIFLATFVYAIGFVGDVAVPKSIDVGMPFDAQGESLPMSLLIDLLLLGIFAIQHSVMARPAFKRWWTRFVPSTIERSTFVMLASTALLFLFLEWRPIAIPVWNVAGTVGGYGLIALSAIGWLLVLAATFQIDHYELFGLKQVWWHLRGKRAPQQEFRTPLLYRQVRHPIYLGFILAFWSTPTMSLGHLVFAAVTTAYIFVGIAFEERDLIAQFGDRYRVYRQQVGMLWPRLRQRHGRRGNSTPLR